MCNIDAGIAKLDSILKELGYCSHSSYIQADQLREILLAMKEDDKKIKIGGYQELALRITQTNSRVQNIEEKCGCKVKFKDEVHKDIHVLVNTCNSLADRLARLEAWSDNADKLLNAHEPSSVSECKHRWGKNDRTGIEWCVDCVEPKPTPTPEVDEKSIHANYCPSHYGKKKKCICNKDNAPKQDVPKEHLKTSVEKCVHDYYPIFGLGYLSNRLSGYVCKKCGDAKRNKEYDTIEISRRVAEEYLKYSRAGLPETNNLVTELKLALSKEGK